MSLYIRKSCSDVPPRPTRRRVAKTGTFPVVPGVTSAAKTGDTLMPRVTTRNLAVAWPARCPSWHLDLLICPSWQVCLFARHAGESRQARPSVSLWASLAWMPPHPRDDCQALGRLALGLSPVSHGASYVPSSVPLRGLEWPPQGRNIALSGDGPSWGFGRSWEAWPPYVP